MRDLFPKRVFDGFAALPECRADTRFQLPATLEPARLADLDATFHFSTANGVVRRSWFNVVIENDYRAGYDALEAFLLGIGRTWLLRPLYKRLAATEDGQTFARQVYARARPGYHSATRVTIDGILAEADR